MAFYYRFEDYLQRFPRAPDDPRRLDLERTARNLIDLRALLDDSAPDNPSYVPPKTSHERLLVATWNIQSLGASQRYDESFWYIAEVLSRFDVVAIQEVKRDLAELDRLCELLGPWWRYLVSDVTEGDPGNDERLAYLFDIRKLRHSGLAGELVLPDDVGDGLRSARQIARTPFVVGFKTAWFNFMMATVHILWGDELADHPLRVEEIRAIAEFLDRRRGQTGTWSRNLILLGDFNIFRPDSVAVEIFREFGFRVPHGRADLRATNVGREARYYDQIAFVFDDDVPPPQRAGVIDVFDAVFTDEKLDDYVAQLRTSTGRVPANPLAYYRNHWRRRQMSDHLVLWTELSVDFSAHYLARHAG